MKPKIAYSSLNFVSKTVAQTRTSKRLIESAKQWCANQNLDLKPCVFETQGLGIKGSTKGLQNFLQEITDRKIKPGSVLILEDLPDYRTASRQQIYRDVSEIIAHGVTINSTRSMQRWMKLSAPAAWPMSSRCTRDPIGRAGCTAASQAIGARAWSGIRRAAAKVFRCYFTRHESSAIQR